MPEQELLADYLAAPVTTIKGISTQRAARLGKLEIRAINDLLTWFPRAYEDWTPLDEKDELQEEEFQAFVATVQKQAQNISRGRLTIQRATLSFGAYTLAAVWFNQPWIIKKIIPQEKYLFYGKIKREGLFLSVQNPDFEIFNPNKSTGQLKPLYSLTAGISQNLLRHWMLIALDLLPQPLPEPIPTAIRKKFQLCTADYALEQIHFPSSQEEMKIARYRLAFEELFLIQAGLRILKQQRLLQRFSQAVLLDKAAKTQLQQVQTNLPFILTNAQKRAIDELIFDLGQTKPMNRLIQGDVGSGKTVVAALAMLACALAGGQAVMMAPTAVLANQHHLTLKKLLADSSFEVYLLTGKTKAAQRREVLSALADGSCQLLVGTHALLEEDINFNNLLLTITDEQHRFGVQQRARLGQADEYTAHNIVMSATPIPRTLALILYGDLDISIIDELPQGRQPVETYTASSADRPRVYNLMRKFLQQGRQVFVICPLIQQGKEEEDQVGKKSELISVTEVFNHLSQEVFPDYKVGLMHSNLKTETKEAVMQAFYERIINILVSTTVVEVGVDQPNAAMMVIENAERFGLAQLHQLRGRIGRGEHRSICVLVSDSQEELARARMRTLCHHQDGFLIAEKDLELRGPGDFFGTRQHGLPLFKIANLYEDRDIIAKVGQSLEEIFRQDPELQEPAHQVILTVLKQRYAEAFPELAL